jgi:hypothetical protein
MTLFVFLNLDDAGFDHFVVKIVAFARAFTDAREHRDTAVQFRDVIDQFHDDDGLADACATERTDLATLQEGADQVDDFDAGGQNLRAGGLVHERRGGAMDGKILVRFHGALLVHGLAGHVEHAAHDGFTHWHRNRSAGVNNFHAALEAFRGAHGDRAHPIVAQMLLHFERQLGAAVAGHIVFDSRRIINGREFVGELNVHDRADDLNDFTFIHEINCPMPSGRW